MRTYVCPCCGSDFRVRSDRPAKCGRCGAGNVEMAAKVYGLPPKAAALKLLEGVAAKKEADAAKATRAGIRRVAARLGREKRSRG